jgi:ABC-type enterochelin transport system permease subunit
MRNLKTQIRVTIALGVLSLFAGFMACLALTDIYHSEADVTLEWSAVRVCALVVLLFIGMALFTLGRILKVLK